jgi:hypothetical protein
MIHGFATVKFLFLPEQHAHGTAACIGEQHAWGGMGRTRYSQSTMILCGQAVQTTQEAVCSGGATCSGKQYARGSSITGSYIASLHEIEDNFLFCFNLRSKLPKKQSAAPLIVDMGASKISFSNELIFYFIENCYMENPFMLLPLGMLLPTSFAASPEHVTPPVHAATPGHDVPFWACCCPLGFLCHLWKVSS